MGLTGTPPEFIGVPACVETLPDVAQLRNGDEYVAAPPPLLNTECFSIVRRDGDNSARTVYMAGYHFFDRGNDTANIRQCTDSVELNNTNLFEGNIIILGFTDVLSPICNFPTNTELGIGLEVRID